MAARHFARRLKTLSGFTLCRPMCWHVESDVVDQARAAEVAAQGDLPIARICGMATTASADIWVNLAAGRGRGGATITAKARYGNDPGIKATSTSTSNLRRSHSASLPPHSARHLGCSTG